jgi:hypothetical protein
MSERNDGVRQHLRQLARADRRHRSGTSHDAGRAGDDRGSVLVVAFIYLIAVSVTVLGLSTWVSNDLNNVKGFTNSRELQQAASSTAEFAMQNIRYTPLLGTNQTWGQFNYCWGNGPTSAMNIDGYTVNAFCSTAWNPTSAVTRTVTIDACPSSITASGCEAPNGAYLQVVVVFDDYPPGGAAPVNGSCVLWSWCGEGETITSWSWQ